MLLVSRAVTSKSNSFFCFMEVWKEVKGFEGYYCISNYGNLKSVDRGIKYPNGSVRYFKGKEQKKTINKGGYIYFDLYKNQKRKRYFAHQLVYLTFIGDYNRKLDINHIDCNKKNNFLNNLELTTRSENMIHALNNNLLKNTIEKATKYRLLVNNEYLTLKEISIKYNLSYTLVRDRNRKGYSIDEIINIKPRHRRYV